MKLPSTRAAVLLQEAAVTYTLTDGREAHRSGSQMDLLRCTPLRVALRAPRTLTTHKRMAGDGIAPTERRQKAQAGLPVSMLEELDLARWVNPANPSRSTSCWVGAMTPNANGRPALGS